jgi:uncharacterized protein YecE (DUF72 family)
MPVRVGTSGWSYREWVGAFYPPRTGPAKMLPFYASRLGTVEAHATYRRRPTPATIDGWIGATPDGFRFAPKAHAAITHQRDLTGIDERVGAFCDALVPLADADRLGPVLFQLPHQQPDIDRLDRILAALPASGGVVAAFELAPAWLVDDVVKRLDTAGATFVLTDSDARDAPDVQVGPVSYVRLRRDQYDAAALEGWAARLRAMAAGGRDVYAYLKHDDAGRAPAYAHHIQGAIAA